MQHGQQCIRLCPISSLLPHECPGQPADSPRTLETLTSLYWSQSPYKSFNTFGGCNCLFMSTRQKQAYSVYSVGVTLQKLYKIPSLPKWQCAQRAFDGLPNEGCGRGLTDSLYPRVGENWLDPI